MNYWMEEYIREQERRCLSEYNNLNATDVSELILLAKPHYIAKDGTIRVGIRIDGKYYKPKDA